MTKQLLIGILATLLTFGLFGTAFAAESIADRNIFDFNAPLTMADKAAMSHNYDQDLLEVVGTERGERDFDFNRPVTKADIAAKNHVYDPALLSEVGTEAGNWQYRHGQIKCSAC